MSCQETLRNCSFESKVMGKKVIFVLECGVWTSIITCPCGEEVNSPTLAAAVHQRQLLVTRDMKAEAAERSKEDMS